MIFLDMILLRAEEEVLLDDITVKELETTLQTPIRIVKSGGAQLIEAILKSL